MDSFQEVEASPQNLLVVHVLEADHPRDVAVAPVLAASTADRDLQACHVHDPGAIAVALVHTTVDPDHVPDLTTPEVDLVLAVTRETDVATEEAGSEADTMIEEPITNHVSRTRGTIPEAGEDITIETRGTTTATSVEEVDLIIITEEVAGRVADSREADTGIIEIVDMIGVAHVIAVGRTAEAGSANRKIP